MALLLVGMSHWRAVLIHSQKTHKDLSIYLHKNIGGIIYENIVNRRYVYTRTLVGLFPLNIVNSQYVCTGLLYTLQCTFAFCSKSNLRGYWIQHLSVREQKNAIFCIKDCGSPDHKYKPSLLFLEFLLPAGWILGFWAFVWYEHIRLYCFQKMIYSNIHLYLYSPHSGM